MNAAAAAAAVAAARHPVIPATIFYLRGDIEDVLVSL